MIYVPDNTYSCYEIRDSGDVIRAYEEMPAVDKTINYRDYYIHSDYIFEDGTTEFRFQSSLPSCINADLITSDFYYRQDIDSILIILMFMLFFCFWIPVKIILRLMRRFNP